MQKEGKIVSWVTISQTDKEIGIVWVTTLEYDRVPYDMVVLGFRVSGSQGHCGDCLSVVHGEDYMITATNAFRRTDEIRRWSISSVCTIISVESCCSGLKRRPDTSTTSLSDSLHPCYRSLQMQSHDERRWEKGATAAAVVDMTMMMMMMMSPTTPTLPPQHFFVGEEHVLSEWRSYRTRVDTKLLCLSRNSS